MYQRKINMLYLKYILELYQKYNVTQYMLFW